MTVKAKLQNEETANILADNFFTFLMPETFQCAKGDFSCALNTSTQAPF